MTGPLYRLAQLCVRRAPYVIAIWLALVVGLVIAGRSVGEDTNDDLSLPGSDATAAQDLLQSEFPKEQFGTNPIVIEAAHGKLTDPQNRPVVKATVRSLRKASHVTGVTSPFSTQGKDALSKDKRIAYASVTLNLGPTDLDADQANDVIAAAEPARKAGLQVAAGGYIGQEVSKTTDSKSDAIGLMAAVVILLFAFGTVVAMGLPIATAILGLASALSILALLSHVFNVPTVGPTLATMIGLGVGIDYALFIVTRHRNQLDEGMEPRESAARAVATAGGAVLFAGGTVVIALCSLAIANIPIVSSLGYSAAISVVVAVLAALTLMPAMLGALGRRIESLRIPIGKSAGGDDALHGWTRYATWISARPWPALLISVVVLIVLAVPTRLLHLGSTDVGQLPTDTTARQAYDLLSRGFQPGVNGPFLIAVDLKQKAKPDQKALHQIDHKEQKLDQQLADARTQATQAALAQGTPQPEATQIADQQTQALAAKVAKDKSALDAKRKKVDVPESDPRLQKLSKKVSNSPGIDSVTPPLVNKRRNAAVFNAVPKTAPSDRRTEDLIRELRSTTIPKTTKGQHMTADVGGATASYVDLADRISDRLPEVIGVVVGLSFLLLLLAFRSIVVPLKAGLMNLISVGAAYGVITFVFQEGHGAKLVGLDHAVPIVSFVPLLMFAILFGLSMDYEVFLISRIQEHYRASEDNVESVIEGLARTGKVITSAALIMVCVFASFLFNGDPTVKQFGLGLAVAIAIDSTIVRCLLVPAAMVLMKTGNWWFPRWLGWLPHLGIEGEEYFAARDAEAELEEEPEPEPTASDETAAEDEAAKKDVAPAAGVDPEAETVDFEPVSETEPGPDAMAE